MGFNFAKTFNKKPLFTVNTDDYKYISMETAYEQYGEDYEYCALGFYINLYSEYNDEEPVVATDKEYINLPYHLLKDIKSIISNPQAVKAVNAGECSFKIRKYYKKRYKKECYTVEWCE